MKKTVLLSIVASTMIMAGGDIAPVEPVVEVPVVVEATPGPFYIGLAYGYVSEDYTRRENAVPDIGSSFDKNFNNAVFQAGYDFNSYVAIEGRYWLGYNDVTTLSGSFNAPNAFGVYVKPIYPVTDAFDIYGLLGYAWTDTDINKLDGFSWGLGTSYSFTDNVSIFVDYVSLYDDNVDFVNYNLVNVKKDYDIDTVNVGVTYNF